MLKAKQSGLHTTATIQQPVPQLRWRLLMSKVEENAAHLEVCGWKDEIQNALFIFRIEKYGFRKA